jgi:hypothetical protein
LKKQKERDRTGTDADASEQRVIKPNYAESLIPASGYPKNRQIKQDGQRGRRFDDKAAQAFTDSIGSEARKNLMSAIKNGGSNRVPEP